MRWWRSLERCSPDSDIHTISSTQRHLHYPISIIGIVMLIEPMLIQHRRWILGSQFATKITQNLQIGLDFGQVGHPHCRATHIYAFAHACELRREFAELRLIRMQQQTHIVVDECQFAGESDVVFEFDVDCAVMFYEAAEVGQEEVLG